MSKQSTTSGGMSLSGVVLVVFIILKLVGVINWSWWLVFMPLWISLGLIVLVLLVGFIILGVMEIKESYGRKRRNAERVKRQASGS